MQPRGANRKFRCEHPVAKKVFSTNKREVHNASGIKLFTASKLIPAIVEYEGKDVRFRKDLSNELDEWIMHSGRFAKLPCSQDDIIMMDPVVFLAYIALTR